MAEAKGRGKMVTRPNKKEPKVVKPHNRYSKPYLGDPTILLVTSVAICVMGIACMTIGYTIRLKENSLENWWLILIGGLLLISAVVIYPTKKGARYKIKEIEAEIQELERELEGMDVGAITFRISECNAMIQRLKQKKKRLENFVS